MKCRKLNSDMQIVNCVPKLCECFLPKKRPELTWKRQKFKDEETTKEKILKKCCCVVPECQTDHVFSSDQPVNCQRLMHHFKNRPPLTACCHLLPVWTTLTTQSATKTTFQNRQIKHQLTTNIVQLVIPQNDVLVMKNDLLFLTKLWVIDFRISGIKQQWWPALVSWICPLFFHSFYERSSTESE